MLRRAMVGRRRPRKDDEVNNSDKNGGTHSVFDGDRHSDEDDDDDDDDEPRVLNVLITEVHRPAADVSFLVDGDGGAGAGPGPDGDGKPKPPLSAEKNDHRSSSSFSAENNDRSADVSDLSGSYGIIFNPTTTTTTTRGGRRRRWAGEAPSSSAAAAAASAAANNNNNNNGKSGGVDGENKSRDKTETTTESNDATTFLETMVEVALCNLCGILDDDEDCVDAPPPPKNRHDGRKRDLDQTFLGKVIDCNPACGVIDANVTGCGGAWVGL